jgi:hypothetical protein
MGDHAVPLLIRITVFVYVNFSKFRGFELQLVVAKKAIPLQV